MTKFVDFLGIKNDYSNHETVKKNHLKLKRRNFSKSILRIIWLDSNQYTNFKFFIVVKIYVASFFKILDKSLKPFNLKKLSEIGFI